MYPTKIIKMSTKFTDTCLFENYHLCEERTDSVKQLLLVKV